LKSKEIRIALEKGKLFFFCLKEMMQSSFIDFVDISLKETGVFQLFSWPSRVLWQKELTKQHKRT